MTGRVFLQHAHAESKGKIEAFDELILEIMPLDHAKSGQGVFTNFEHKFCPDRLATEVNAIRTGNTPVKIANLKNEAPKS